MSKRLLYYRPALRNANRSVYVRRFEYLWQDSENYKRQTKMAAPAYIEQLMTWVQGHIDNEATLPSRIGKIYP